MTTRPSPLPLVRKNGGGPKAPRRHKTAAAPFPPRLRLRVLRDPVDAKRVAGEGAVNDLAFQDAGQIHHVGNGDIDACGIRGRSYPREVHVRELQVAKTSSSPVSE